MLGAAQVNPDEGKPVAVRGMVLTTNPLVKPRQNPSANFASSDINSGVHGGVNTILG